VKEMDQQSGIGHRFNERGNLEISEVREKG
jgi:hypothetical protein